MRASASAARTEGTASQPEACRADSRAHRLRFRGPAQAAAGSGYARMVPPHRRWTVAPLSSPVLSAACASSKSPKISRSRSPRASRAKLRLVQALRSPLSALARRPTVAGGPEVAARLSGSGARLLRDCPTACIRHLGGSGPIRRIGRPGSVQRQPAGVHGAFPPRSGDGIEPSKRGVATPCPF
jgi:hypothetical protein